MKTVDLVIGPIGELNTPLGFSARRGDEMDQLMKLSQAGIAIDKKHFVAIGTWKEIRRQYRGRQHIQWPQGLVLPGFVDSHTHALFAKSRSWEYGLRLRGVSYLDIAKKGGGILNSCRDLKKASAHTLRQNLKKVLQRMRQQGTTTVEIKSGYGLTLASEIKMLEVIQSVARRHPMRLISTFLGAHEIPEKYRSDRSSFINLVTDKWIAQIAQKKLAEFCDVFCDVGVFSAKEAHKILASAKKQGLKLKIHSDEFEAIGGIETVAPLGVTSADHLGTLNTSGLQALKKQDGKTIATLLPGTCLTLDLKKWPPARRLIEHNIPVALATDCNPGSCMTESLPLIMSLACNRLRMTAEEALTAVTLNGAAAVDRSQVIGSIEVGKFSDLSFWSCQHLEEIPYHLNGNLCCGTLIGSELSLEYEN